MSRVILRIWPLHGRPVDVIAERVSTREALQRGLMFRPSLQPNAGMLFDYGRREVHTMWMKNTLIPLDMVFLDGPYVIGVVHNARPHDLRLHGTSEPSTHVLELPGGFCARYGIGRGATCTAVAPSSIATSSS